jgi:sec-independent protein translocase protein TatC
MCLLFFVGIFASYLLVLNREGRRFPWSRVLIPVLLVLIVVSGGLILAITKFGLHLVPRWPFLMR